ncbi:MAG: PKD domain-containing protein [Saprospiraceae bacterium]|nr:PKD domain-containing protein [Saprospiraceae bacterium]
MRNSQNLPNLIKVVPSPVAGFSFTPEEPSLINNTVQFIDESKDAVAYLWKFDSLAISLVKDPSYTFRDTGVFNIQQIVLHPRDVRIQPLCYYLFIHW